MLTICQQQFLEALERAAKSAGINTTGLALHHIIGGIMVEHTDHPRVKAALQTIKDREDALYAARAAR